MKIRTGFVSNSSSASFICEVCGDEYSGDGNIYINCQWTWDACLREAEMVECKSGHIFCEDHADREIIEKLKAQDLDDEDSPDWDEEWRCSFPEKYCPLCSFKEVPRDTLVKYLLKKVKMSQASVEDEIREKFGNLAEFTTQMKESGL